MENPEDDRLEDDETVLDTDEPIEDPPTEDELKKLYEGERVKEPEVAEPDEEFNLPVAYDDES